MKDQGFALSAGFMNLSGAQNSRRHSSVGGADNYNSSASLFKLGKIPGDERVFTLLIKEIVLRVVRADSG